MKLIVTIKAGDSTQDIVLPVGHGTQSFKWLADAAAFRYIHDGVSARHGHLSNSRRQQHSLPPNTNLLPKDVYNEDCPFFHPEDVIKDHVTDGQRITVELYTELPLDEYGIPKLSHWAFIAFRHGESQSQLERKERYVQEKRAEVEKFQIERIERARLRQIEIERPKILRMREVLADQLIDSAVIESTLNEEWVQIKESGILDNLVPDEAQQEEVRSFLLKNYVELTDLYKFYSAVNSGGGTHTLEFIELNKFLTETSILGEEHSSAILRIFIDSHIGAKNGKSKVKPSIHSQIHRHEFFVALIKIAIICFLSIARTLFWISSAVIASPA
jgi:hypothetical protein